MSDTPHHCTVCLRDVTSFTDGPAGRPNARCPACDALERHRFVALVVHRLAPIIASGERILDIAPMSRMRWMMESRFDARYIGLDISREPIVQVPFRCKGPTIEDVDAPAEERIRLFGQEDHVRRYGEDFPDLLAAHGLHPARLTPGDLLGRRELDRYGIPLEEELWICARDEPPVLLLEARVELHGQLVVPLHGQGDVAREMLAEVEARYWRRRYERLAVHPVVGILLALRRLAIRLKRAVRQRG